MSERQTILVYRWMTVHGLAFSFTKAGACRFIREHVFCTRPIHGSLSRWTEKTEPASITRGSGSSNGEALDNWRSLKAADVTELSKLNAELKRLKERRDRLLERGFEDGRPVDVKKLTAVKIKDQNAAEMNKRDGLGGGVIMANEQGEADVKADPKSNILEFKVGRNSRPSWRRYGDGWENVRASRHKKAGWLTVSIEESYESDSGRMISRYTSTDLKGDVLKKFLEVAAPGYAELTRDLKLAIDIIETYRPKDESEPMKQMKRTLKKVRTSTGESDGLGG